MNSIELPLRIDEKLGKLSLPEMLGNAMPILNRNDCLVFCSGFEERSMVVLKSAIQHKSSDSFGAVLIDYLPENKANQSELAASLCAGSGLDVKKVTYNREAPTGIGSTIANNVNRYDRVFIDISGMSRLLLVQILVALGKRERSFKGISVFYAEAQVYPPSMQEFEAGCTKAEREGVIDSFISSGVFEVAITPELSSVSMQGEAIRLITFPSFNRTQLQALISEVQPTFVNVVDGMPPRDENKWRLQAIRRCNIKTIGSIANLEEITLNTLDYRETLGFLLDVYNKRSAFDRLVIAPTGSKMQAVSVGLFRAFMDDVQIVYPTPQTFPEPERHTEGVREIYQLDLDKFAAVASSAK